MGLKILVTGAAGLIGSKFVEYLTDNVEDVDTIIGVDNLSGGLIENINYFTYGGSIDSNGCITSIKENGKVLHFYIIAVESDDLNDIFEKHKPDIVFHAAAYAAEAASPFIRKYNVINNSLASANITNNCINYDVKRLVFLSSTAVYGVGNPPFKEEHIPSPIDPYGVAKYANEMDIKIAGDQHKLDWCIIRPRNVYGIGQNIFDPLRNLFGIWMYRNINGAPLLIYGDGTQQRMFTYIDDILPGLWKSCVELQCSKEIINLGGIHSYTIKEAAETLIKVMGKGSIKYVEPRHEVKNTACDWEKSVRLLGFEHKTSLEEGLTKMWKWSNTLQMRSRLIFDKYEVNKGLYSYWEKDRLTLMND